MKKSILRNTLSLALCAALMLTLLPVTALAADGTISTGDTYDLIAYGNGSVITISTTQPVTLRGDPTVTYTNMQINCIVAGVSLTLSNVNINNSCDCALSFTGVGNTLALEGSSTLTSGFNFPGVRVANDTELTISDGAGTGTGQLTATGGDYGGGIGGDGGTVTITGGSVKATGAGGGAGIGGGCGGNGGSVTIRGGTVTATGVNGGAGIGGGRGGDGGMVTINGGTVTSSSNSGGAGIGGGYGGGGGTVIINGGTITAIGGNGGGAGIGGGEGGDGGTVTITGGSVKATGAGGGGALIAGGAGTLYISGGSVNTTDGSSLSGTPAVPVRSSTGNTPVYLAAVTLDGAGITAVSSLTTDASYTYGIKDMKTDASGKLYLYLPVNTNTTAARTAFVRYAGSVATTTNSATSLGTLSPDSAAPAVSAVDPNSTGAAVSGNIAITFSEEMRTGAGAVSLDGGATNLAAESWNADKTVYTASYSGLAYSTSYTVTISGFQDYSGNEMDCDTTNSFTTLSGGGDGSSTTTTPSPPRRARAAASVPAAALQ